ncbi:unnamed protein product [Gongylonema pulchrum]|uniref:Killing trait domain-containing protein n=1 Tax=Gongylonema pulchrum TaxID=637853 RepID=A0A183EUN7_9BILA|nr:unnamed protein product [Gongylonema pulchrum]
MFLKSRYVVKAQKNRSIPSVQFSRLSPVPPLPISPASNNIVEAVLTQSQARIAPLTAPSAGTDQNTFGNSVASLLASSDAMENLARFARNMLSLPISKQGNILSSLASAITAGSRIQTAPTNAVIETSVEPPSNILNAQQIFAELSKIF